MRPEWTGFTEGHWTSTIDVRNFIQRNYTPYEGDDSFLEGPTNRTEALWADVRKLMDEEHKRGILDAETKIPSSITSHGPGYIGKEKEQVVGFQTDAPLKRGIIAKGWHPHGGKRAERLWV